MSVNFDREQARGYIVNFSTAGGRVIDDLLDQLEACVMSVPDAAEAALAPLEQQVATEQDYEAARTTRLADTLQVIRYDQLRAVELIQEEASISNDHAAALADAIQQQAVQSDKDALRLAWLRGFAAAGRFVQRGEETLTRVAEAVDSPDLFSNLAGDRDRLRRVRNIIEAEHTPTETKQGPIEDESRGATWQPEGPWVELSPVQAAGGREFIVHGWLARPIDSFHRTRIWVHEADYDYDQVAPHRLITPNASEADNLKPRG